VYCGDIDGDFGAPSALQEPVARANWPDRANRGRECPTLVADEQVGAGRGITHVSLNEEPLASELHKRLADRLDVGA